MLYRKVLSKNESIQALPEIRHFKSPFDRPVGRLIRKLGDTYKMLMEPKGYTVSFDFQEVVMKKGYNRIVLNTRGFLFWIHDESESIVQECIDKYNERYKPKVNEAVEEPLQMAKPAEIRDFLTRSQANSMNLLLLAIEGAKSKRKFEGRFLSANRFFPLSIYGNMVEVNKVRNEFLSNLFETTYKGKIMYAQIGEVLYVATHSSSSQAILYAKKQELGII